MTQAQTLITVAAIALTTFATRALPFLLFPAGKKTPKFVVYLGKVLPCAMIGMLVVYCFKGTAPLKYPYGLPELISAAAVVLLHIWKKNSFLSIGAGTVLYMILVQFVFV